MGNTPALSGIGVRADAPTGTGKPTPPDYCSKRARHAQNWYDARMPRIPPSQRVRNDLIVPEETWVIGDTHFGHNNIVGFCHRPEDHEQVMIAEWRKEVPDDATVLHIGDLAYRNNGFFKHIIAKELTGARKLLIRGNHDKHPRRFYSDAGFDTVLPFTIHYDSRVEKGLWASVSFSHYPWNPAEEGEMSPWDWRVHGHIHNNGYSRGPFAPFLKHHINVGVEQVKYRPVNLARLLDAAIFGIYEETTEAQLAEAAARKAGLR